MSAPATTRPPVDGLADLAGRFQRLTAALAEVQGDPDRRRYALADLADWVRGLGPAAFAEAVGAAPAAALDAPTLNHLAGAVELAAERRGVAPPAWAGAVPPGETPVFGSELGSLRPYLLTHAPVALRRRNLFFDASFDDRV